MAYFTNEKEKKKKIHVPTCVYLFEQLQNQRYSMAGLNSLRVHVELTRKETEGLVRARVQPGLRSVVLSQLPWLLKIAPKIQTRFPFVVVV